MKRMAAQRAGDAFGQALQDFRPLTLLLSRSDKVPVARRPSGQRMTGTRAGSPANCEWLGRALDVLAELSLALARGGSAARCA